MSEKAIKPGVDRRLVVKGAAWSVPVLATAVSVPFASASVVGADVRVTARCAGQYDISELEELLDDVSLLNLPLELDDLTGLVKAALSLLGFNEGAAREFTISADSGAIPAGTQFALTMNPPSLIELQLLQELLNVQVGFIASVNSTGTILTTGREITASTPVKFDLQSLLLDATVLGSTTLALIDDDAPDNPSNEAPDSASINTLVASELDLGTLDLEGVLETVLPGTVNAGLRVLIRTVLGLTGGLNILNGVKLRVQLCGA